MGFWVAVMFSRSCNLAPLRHVLMGAIGIALSLGAFQGGCLAQAVSPPSAAAPQPSRAGGPAPQFRDFAVNQRHQGPNAPLVLAPEQRDYRTRLSQASRQQPNFAGRFVLSQWGCGAGCTTGAVYDATTGAVVMLPFTICCATPDNAQFRSIEFRLNSSLVVFAGLRDEREGDMAAHFYAFDGRTFRHLASVANDGRFAGDR